MATDREIQELARTARELVERIDVLVTGTGDQMVDLSHVAKVNRRLILMLCVGLAVEVILSVGMVFGLLSLQKVTTRVDTSIKLTQAQVLCPLYQQFINADTPAGRELARKNGQDLKTRDEAFRVIRQSYEVLNCK